METPWERVLSRYEFAIALTSFRRNMDLYFEMDLGQLRTAYSQIVSFSPARILCADTLVAYYNTRASERRAQGGRVLEKGGNPPLRHDSPPMVPPELSEAVTLALGNGVPKRFVHECMSAYAWLGYEKMVLSSFAAVDSVRGGALKYMALVKASRRDVASLHTIAALAITGWMLALSEHGERCTCGVWPQALELISCFVPDAETSLSLQDVTRVSAYIRTLMDIRQEPVSLGDQQVEPRGPAPDYGYVFGDLLVSGLEEMGEAGEDIV